MLRKNPRVYNSPRCKRLRRSPRLAVEQCDSKSSDAGTMNDPLGYFGWLPMETRMHILSYLQIEELSILTITSKELRNVVEFLRTSYWPKNAIVVRLVEHSKNFSREEQALIFKQYRELGLLMKRSTCLYATKDRLKFVIQALNKYMCSVQRCDNPMQCLALVCYGKLLHTVIAGWEDKECVKMLEAICSASLMDKHLENVLRDKPGRDLDTELKVRLFFRRVFVDPSTSYTDKAFWIQEILRAKPLVHQARIIFLLFGPFEAGSALWFEMCEGAPMSVEHAKESFGNLANAFKILHGHAKSWNEDDVLSVMEELTSFPDEWLAENVATLLFMCGENIVLRVLNSKAINGRFTELASILTHLALVCVRHQQSAEWLFNIALRVSYVFESIKQRTTFFFAIIDMFRELIMDTNEYEYEESPEHLPHLLAAQTSFSKHLALLAVTGNTQANETLAAHCGKQSHAVEE